MKCAYSVRAGQILSILLTMGLSSWGKIARADFVIGQVINIPNVNSSSADAGPSVTGDGLELYFVSNRDHGADICYCDIWVSKRPTTNDEWGAPVNLGPVVNTSGPESDPSISADGLELYFSEHYPRAWRACGPRPGGYGGGDLWVTKRETRDAEWGTPMNLGPQVNSTSYDGTPSISADGLVLLFSSERPGGYGGTDLYMTTRLSKNDPWEPALNVGPPVNTSTFETAPQMSPDGLWLFFTVHPHLSNGDVLVSRRVDRSDPWGPPERLAGIHTSETEYFSAFSADGLILYFSRAADFRSWQSDLLRTWDLLQAEIIPIVDFNGDGMVAIEDLVWLIESWGQNNPAVDIGPTPFGDGTIDLADLEVLIGFWGRELDDPTLLGHWPFDETEGWAVHDVAGDYDAEIVGMPLWHSEDGVVNGAMQFDGATFAITETLVVPADKPLSVLAWVKGGAPGQSVLSQQGCANWLMADASGQLGSQLASGGRDSRDIVSAAVVTDGDWHRIAFTWDGSLRRLYVDGVLVAEDAQSGLAGSSGQMLLGCGRDMAPGSFWSGLIDDIRVYQRVVIP